MKHVKIFTATVVAMALTASISLAGPNCGAKASAQQVSEKSCSSTATATTVSAGTCASKATTASSGSCASKATAASSGSCASKATYTASNGASCASKASMASANCSPEECSARKIVYTASFGEKDKWTTDRAEATAWAEKGATVQYMAAGKTFSDEHDAAQTLATALYTEMQELMTVAYAVEGEVMHCAKTAEAKAVSAGCASKMKYTVAGREFASQQDAEKHLEKVQMRLASVAKLMDDKGNPVEGCAVGHSKKAGDCTFVFGDQKIEDPTIANVAVLQERVQAILDTEA
jgi:hypothetical protein